MTDTKEIWIKFGYNKAMKEQDENVKKLREEIDKVIENYKAVEINIGEYDKFISVHKLKLIIDEIFADSGEERK